MYTYTREEEEEQDKSLDIKEETQFLLAGQAQP